jgi:hypothetical protein
MRELIFQTTTYNTPFKKLGFFPEIHIFGKKIYVIRGGDKKPHKIKKLSTIFFSCKVGGGRRGGELHSNPALEKIEILIA